MRKEPPMQFEENTGFAQILERSARLLPDKTALVFGERTPSYRELDDRANRLANALAARGLGVGSHVGILMPNCPEFLEIVFAAAKLGAVAVKINWRLSPREIQKMVDFNDVDLLFFRMGKGRWREELEQQLDPALSRMDMDGPDYEGMLAAHAPDYQTPPIDPESVVMHIHTSGTSGMPKCVMHTHGALLREVGTCIGEHGFTRELVFQVMTQLFHSASVGTYMCLGVGGTLVLLDHFRSESYLESVEKNRVTRISAIPTVLAALLDHPGLDRYDLSSLETVNYSTAPIPPSLLDAAMDRLDCSFVQSYGMTEMAAILTTLGGEDHKNRGSKRLYSVGRPIPGAAVKIAGESGGPLPAGEIGEIAVRGPGMMKGYYKMPQATAAAVRDGWYYSGDMGYLDQGGYLFLVGRKNDMIITGGENVYPKEVEDALLEMRRLVSEAAVFGLPDPVWGERVCACIVPYPGRSATPGEVQSFCRERIAGYKVPKAVFFLEELPKNVAGKVMRDRLQSRFGAEPPTP